MSDETPRVKKLAEKARALPCEQKLTAAIVFLQQGRLDLAEMFVRLAADELAAVRLFGPKAARPQEGSR